MQRQAALLLPLGKAAQGPASHVKVTSCQISQLYPHDKGSLHKLSMTRVLKAPLCHLSRVSYFWLGGLYLHSDAACDIAAPAPNNPGEHCMPLCVASLIYLHADPSFTSTQDVARLQPALSALPARPSPNQGPPLLHPQQHPQQYSQAMAYQTAQSSGNPRPWTQQAWQGLAGACWGRPTGHAQLNQVRCFSTLQLSGQSLAALGPN